MIINLSPVFSEEKPVELFVNGDVITVYSDVFDFGPLKKRQTLPRSAIDNEYFDGPVTRGSDGEITLTILFTHPFNASDNMKFPKPIHIKSGIVSLPQNETPAYVVDDTGITGTMIEEEVIEYHIDEIEGSKYD